MMRGNKAPTTGFGLMTEKGACQVVPHAEPGIGIKKTAAPGRERLKMMPKERK
jgi:hypothetical protein